MEAVILLLKKKQEQHNDFEEFIKETEGSRLILAIDVPTDLYSVIEAVDSERKSQSVSSE